MIKSISYAPDYYVTDKGVVYSDKSGVRKKLADKARGEYRMVTLCVGKARLYRLVHRLVLEAFCGIPDDNHEARHLNGNASDNRITNLKWGTPKENAEDKRLHGTQVSGESHGGSKLTKDQVVEIKKRLITGETHLSVSSNFPVSREMIGRIARGERWCN